MRRDNMIKFIESYMNKPEYMLTILDKLKMSGILICGVVILGLCLLGLGYLIGCIVIAIKHKSKQKHLKREGKELKE